MAEWAYGVENDFQNNDSESLIPDFTNFGILTSDTSETRTNDFDVKTFNSSLSSEV